MTAQIDACSTCNGDNDDRCPNCGPRQYAVENMHRIEPREAAHSLVLNREVLPAAPGGIAADVRGSERIYTVSKLDGETGWTVDGECLPNGLPIFFNGEGARYLRLRPLTDAAAIAALDAAAALLIPADPADHVCEDNAVPYVSDGPLGHGWECGVCGSFLQAG